MRSLQPTQLLSFLGVGLVLGLAAAQLLAGLGMAYPLSPWSLIITLPIIGIGVYIASVPIARYRKKMERYAEGPRPERPNPFFAFRLLLISRATALTGALFAGWHFGGLIWLLSFSVAPGALTSPTALGLAGSLAMLAGGLIAEQNCKAPKDPGEEAQ